MNVDLEKLPSDQSHLTGDEVIPYRLDDGEEVSIECHIELDVRRVGETYYISAQLSGHFSTHCDLCLKPVRYSVEPSFEVALRRSREASADDIADGAEDYIVLPYSIRQFSLDRHIYENLVVDVPMQIACREGCRGLCAGCGENLNSGICRCEKPANSQWNELKKLKDQLP